MEGGHGHVTPRPDGQKARCGGPLACAECARELAEKMTLNDLDGMNAQELRKFIFRMYTAACPGWTCFPNSEFILSNIVRYREQNSR